MMKRFIAAMLGSLAGIWLSVILFMLLMFVTIIAMAVGGNSSGLPVDITEHSVLYLDLSGSIEERKPEANWMNEIYGSTAAVQPLNDILNSIKSAAEDERIDGIYINCDGATAGLATHNEIIDAITQFKLSGKWVYAYADSYTQGNYYIACSADSIFLNPLGSVDIRGLSATTMFYKGLLDKLGVEMQVIKVGTYKSAVEPFLLAEMSEASRQQQEHYIGSIWNNFSNNIATMRFVEVEDVNQWADSLTITQSAETYIDIRIVDKLLYRHEMEEILKKLCFVDEDDEINFITPEEYCNTINSEKILSDENNIAVLYAVGDIVDQGTEGIVGRTLAPQILEIAEDDDIDALILRVNSGGGSAFASEQIWEALEQFKSTGKPFYVSMGDVAASGGYYISSGADKIYAEPVTLTGSIGIFGMIPCVKELMTDKLGITTGTVSSNANGDFMSLSSPLTEYQRMSMQRMINQGYETFVKRCAEGRGVSTDDIKKIAEGRVWDGATALEIGLVDKLGGIHNVIEDMAKDLGYESYNIKEYPSSSTNIWDILMNAQAQIKQNILEEELGETYKYFKAIDNMKEIAPIQCRMEQIEIK